jgi:hypothetical protein
MAQSYLMTIDQHDRKKNLEAGAYTAVILIALALLLFLVSWQLPKPVEPDPPLELQGIEVNLGTDETGFGADQPLLPGEPAPSVANTPSGAPAENAGENAGDDPDSDVPLPTNTNTKPNIKPTDVVKATTKPVTNPVPAPPKPKAVFNGKTSPNSNGTGGNGADSYYKGSNQGIAGGKGDQGAPGGDPNSDSYKGDGKGKGGVRISSGLSGRKVGKVPSFEDDFNENAKVAIDVTVNASGKVISATVNPRGTTTTNSKTRNIAIKNAYLIPFTAGSGESKGTIIIDLKIN